jgi:hypothetical protein
MNIVERVISVFCRQDGSLVNEINVDHINLELLRGVFKPKHYDNDLHYVYPINIEEATLLKSIIDFDFDFDNYEYQLDCFAKEK